MKTLIAFACLALTLASCTNDTNPTSPSAPLYRAVQELDGSWTYDVDVPPNPCGVPAGIFTINVTSPTGGSSFASWSAVNESYAVTKVAVVTWSKTHNRDGLGFTMPEKIVNTWTVKMLPDGPTVTWVETIVLGANAKTTISRVKCI